MAWPVSLLIMGLLAGVPSTLNAGESGRVYFQRLAAPDLDAYTNSPNPAEKLWITNHFWRMAVFSPYFDARLRWYPKALVYFNLYGLQTKDFSGPSEWILRDIRGYPMYIPWGCSKDTCPQYAANIANPAFRADWIRQAKVVFARGYKGLWIDDVNMEFRVSDSVGKHAVPYNPINRRIIDWQAWRGYVASFVEEIRRSLPEAEIVHNSIWFAGPPEIRDGDSDIKRQIAAADNINIERGVASDPGLTGGSGPWSLQTLFSFIDRVHQLHRGVTLEEYKITPSLREYALAAYFLISTGDDRIGDADMNPVNWWSGYDVDLGLPLGSRTYRDGIFTRKFSRGEVFLGEPGLVAREVELDSTMKRINGSVITSLTIRSSEGAILRR